MTKKKETAATKKAAVEDSPPAGDAPDYYGPMLRPLAAGSIVYLLGSNTALSLKTDAHVMGDGIEKDQKWVGMLARSQDNWDLNIGSVEGTWNPVTCTRQEDPAEESEAEE